MLHDPALCGVAIELRMDTDLQASPEIQQAVFRLVQEAVTNSLKHSDASRIRVDIGSDGDGNLEVSVTDNGGASHRSTAVSQFGNGLTGMQERIRALAGSPGSARRRRLAGQCQHPGWRVEMIRVLLVDDQALVRAGLRALIDACATLQVVGEAGNGRHSAWVANCGPMCT